MLPKKQIGATHGDVAAIFSNIELLLETHEVLLANLLELNKSWPTINSVGEIFVTMVGGHKVIMNGF
jgi:hypothetical protein